MESPSPAVHSKERLLRLPVVLERLGLKKTAWYDGIQKGYYPRQVKLGRASAWRESDILNIIKGSEKKPAGA